MHVGDERVKVTNETIQRDCRCVLWLDPQSQTTEIVPRRLSVDVPACCRTNIPLGSLAGHRQGGQVLGPRGHILICLLLLLPLMGWVWSLQGIKVVKYSGLEDTFSDRVRAARAKQAKPLRKTYLGKRAYQTPSTGDSFAHGCSDIRAVSSTSLVFGCYLVPSLLDTSEQRRNTPQDLPGVLMVTLSRVEPTFVNVLAFVSYALLYQDTRPEVIFSAPHLLRAPRSVCLVGDFMLLPEKPPSDDKHPSPAVAPAPATAPADGAGAAAPLVSMRGATFRWAEPPTVPPSVTEAAIRADLAGKLLAEWKRQAKLAAIAIRAAYVDYVDSVYLRVGKLVDAAKERRQPPPHPPGAAEIPVSIMAPLLAQAGLATQKGVAVTPPSPSLPPAPQPRPMARDCQSHHLGPFAFDPLTTTTTISLPPSSLPGHQAAALLASVQRAQVAEAAEAASRRQQPPALRDITFDVPRGSLTMVVGPVGSGKSSLAAAMIGEITRVAGEVAIGGTLSYCAQQAWITNGTVRENILFGMPFDEERYRRAVEVCALEPDFKILAAGDQTALGEKGGNLSGGQKQRISLARSVYSDREVYLWDDPLSAVDAHVGKHIFERCIRGQLRGRTMILITNQLQYLEHADQVIVLKDGAIEAKGTYSDLRSRGFDFSQYVVKGSAGAPSAAVGATGAVAAEEDPTRMRSPAMAPTPSPPPVGETPQMVGETAQPMVATAYFHTYAGPLGWLWLALLFIATEGAATVSAWWLQQWTGGVYQASLGPFYYPMLIYAMIGVAQAVVALLRAVLWVNVSIRSVGLQ
ncbi:putative Multidrug resistance-associated protein 9 [Paratrimastix pyriformis]|uniref:Multidrug resistance-associated protein 9 n=1 Tax=Paratrimastix pyriformis TaxID=342808 RepID=A0ABQ8U9G3_9EUKA|nr:putative Multidrug resistance-associated protein 9 [Paratrimastix pyriformis]